MEYNIVIMRRFQEKRRWKIIIFSPWLIIGLFIVAILLSISTIGVYLKSRSAVEKNEAVKAQIAELEKRKQDLEGELEVLKTESGLEQEIREKFNVKKPGEEILVIVDKPDENAKINSSGFDNKLQKIWQMLKEIF